MAWLSDRRSLANRTKFPRTQGQRGAAGFRGPFVKVIRGQWSGLAANTNFVRPGNGYKWRVISLSLTLTTDATVANRKIGVSAVDENGTVFYHLMYTPDQAASLSKLYELGPVGIGYNTAGVGSTGIVDYKVALSMPMPLIDQMGLGFVVYDGVAGDLLQFALCVEEIRGLGNEVYG